VSDYVSIPIAEFERLRDELDAALEIEEPDPVKRVRAVTNTMNEAISAGLDYHALFTEVSEALGESETRNIALQAQLTDVVGTIGEYLGRSYVADPQGCEAAAQALREAVQCLAPPVDDRKAWLALMREAVRAQDPTCTLEVVNAPRLDRVVETIEDYPIPPGAALVEGLTLHLPGIKGKPKRVSTVVRVTGDGRATIVRAKVWGPAEDF
jgi:hypothetical protein